MTQKSAQTIAYPAESMFQPAAPEVETVATMELTPVEAMHSVWAGIGTFLAAFAVRCLLAGQWAMTYAVSALLWGLFVCGCLLIVRYVFDLGAILKNQFATIGRLQSALAAQKAETAQAVAWATHFEQSAENERARALNAEARASRPQPAQQEPQPATYAAPRITPEQQAALDEHNTVDWKKFSWKYQENATDWAIAILRNYDQFGHIRRDGTDGVMKAQGLTKDQYKQGRDLLVDLGIVGGNQHVGYEVAQGVDADNIIEAYRNGVVVGQGVGQNVADEPTLEDDDTDDDFLADDDGHFE